MRAFPKGSYFKTGSVLLFLFLILIAGLMPVKAVQKPKDTVSSNDVQFTTIPATVDSISAGVKHIDSAVQKQAAIVKKVASQSAKDAPKTLWGIFIAGLLGGFAAFLMPCIYPMVPLTVSFFTKKGGSRSKGIFNSALYGLCIIFIYVFIGILVTIIFGPTALNDLATNGIFNFCFFLLLIVFGASVRWQRIRRIAVIEHDLRATWQAGKK